MKTIEIFRINQLLFLGAGFIHLNTIASGILVPLWGLTFVFVATGTYFVLSFMNVILNDPETAFEDFFEVTKSEKYPSAGKNVVWVLLMMVLIVPLILLYNLDLSPYPLNSALFTALAGLVGGFAFMLATGNWKKTGAVFLFSLLGIPVTLASLIIGAVVTLPMLYIFLHKRF